MAEKINRRSGGALVKPWEIDAVPDEFREAYTAFDTVTRRRAQREANEKLFHDFRKRFKYRQY